MNDHELHQRIENLVSEEHGLFDKDGQLSDDERRRLDEINVQLDRLWDLLRQRRARQEFRQNPDDTSERSANVVEKYLQ
jgi:hypothetical protein